MEHKLQRPIFIITLGFIIGIIGGLYFNIVPFIFLLMSVLVIVLKMTKIKNSNYILKIIYIFIKNNTLLLLLLSSFLSSLYIINYNNKYKSVYNYFSSKEITGTIISNNNETEYNDIYIIKLDEYKGINFLLRIEKSKNIILKYGDKIKVWGEYKVPEISRNYGGFNYREFLKTQKVYGIYEVNNVDIIKNNNLSKIAILSNKVKQKIIININNVLPKETKELFLGILIGYDDNLQEDIVESFKKSSLSHLLAVSGAHVTYIIIGLTYLLSKLKILKSTRNYTITLFLIFFMYITSFTPSVVRAVVMGIVSLMAFLFRRKYDLKSSMSLSILIILIDNPYKILDIGFLLSYFATIGIILFVCIPKKSNREKDNTLSIKILNYIEDLISITIFANIFVIPIILYYFNTISINFIVSNLVAGILIGPITILGFILIFVSFIHIKLAYIMAIPYNLLLVTLINTTQLVSEFPLSEIILPTPSVFSVLIYYILLFNILFYKILKNNYSNRYLFKKLIKFIKHFQSCVRENKKNIILSVIICILVTIVISMFIPYSLKIYFIDVGQGDSTLIITPSNKKILIDSGGQETGNFDVGKSTLVPYLLDRGINSIDYICISHFDSDHCKGFIYLLNHIRVKNIIFSKQPESSSNFEEILSIVENKKINAIIVKKGDNIAIEKDICLKILWPNENHFISENTLNNNSIVCKLCYKNFSLLFTGDIEEIAEKEIVQVYKRTNLLESDILKIAHHRF